MEKIGNQKIWSYFDGASRARPATNHNIRAGSGHLVKTYLELAKKIAALQFLNREHVLLFRGQESDYRTIKGTSTVKATLFRLSEARIPTPRVLSTRFETLRQAEAGLVARYADKKFAGVDRLRRHRSLRWAILQHYEVCRTPLLDVTHSLRIAASFASLGKKTTNSFLLVFGVPNLSGAVTASSEASLQIIRLSSACPPEAVRPHMQEGYLVGEYPEIVDFDQNTHYPYYEMDFGRRLVAKFRFDPRTFWKNRNFPAAPREALYPTPDQLLTLTTELKTSLSLASTAA